MAELLFREFCNHMYLGQWELAKACALILIKNDYQDGQTKTLLNSTLSNIIRNPHIVRSAWTTVPCPSYVNFLSCQMLIDLGHVDEATTQKQQAGFNIMLETFIPKPKLVINELSLSYSHLLEVTDGHPNQNLELSDASISSLTNAFMQNPVAISKLLNMISTSTKISLESNICSVICDIHIQNLFNCLKTLKCSFGNTQDTQNSKGYADKIYFLLSILPESVLDANKQFETDKLFLSINSLFKSEVLDLALVHQSLFNRSSPAVFQYFCEFLDKARKDSFFLCVKGCLSYENAFLESVKTSHFLHILLEFCNKKIVTGNETLADNALKDPLLSRLKPLLLIFSWNSCEDNASAKNVIEAVKNWNKHSSDVSLVEAYKKFKLDTTLTDLFIECYQELFRDASLSDVPNKTRYILSRLQIESPLRILHSVFGLKNLSSEKVNQLLNHAQGERTRAVELSNTVVYNGYVVLILIMDAIQLSCEYKDNVFAKKLNFTQILGDIRSLDGEFIELHIKDSPETKNTSLQDYFNLHGPLPSYCLFILSNLKKARKLIKTIFPITFRIEILENIFSLLFLMSNDLQNSIGHCSDSDQGHEGEASCGNTPSSENERSFASRLIISTVKLKDFQKKFSRVSSKSTESNSSCGLQSYTFLCNEVITKDLLILLKDSIIEAKLYSAMDDVEDSEHVKFLHEAEDDPQFNSNLSISHAALPERISQLLQYVNDAIWRYAVVESSIFRGSFGMFPKKTHLFQNQFSASSSDGTDKEGRKRRKKKRQKRNIANHKKESFAESSIIQCMLSSPEALLGYSLWSRNLKQAGQVIDLFHLKESTEAKEVILIQELQRISNKLIENEKIKRKPPNKNTFVVSDLRSLMSSVQAIGEAAASGLRSSKICLIIHEELANLKVPEIIDITGGVRHPELILGSRNIPSIFLADLGYISNISHELSSLLLEMASATWNSIQSVLQNLDSKVLSKKKMPLIRGIFKTLAMMNSLLKEFLNFFEVDDFDEKWRFLFWPMGKSFDSFSLSLPGFIGSLDCQRFKEEISSWNQTSELFKELTHIMKVEEAIEKNEVLESNVSEENKLHTTYKKLSKMLRELKGWSSEMIRPQQVRYINYLSKLLNHLHQVTAAVLDCKKQNLDTDTPIYRSDFSILKESTVELVKKIILQSGVTPEKIEKFAIRMKVDVDHVLVQACFPRVPLLYKGNSTYKSMQSTCVLNAEGHTLVLLNKRKDEWLEPRHPDIVARELLKDAIAVIQDTVMANSSTGIFSLENLWSVTDNSDMANWLEECSELAFVNLDVLQTEEEKLAFFVNVTNLSWLNAIFHEVISWKAEVVEAEPSSDFSTDRMLNGMGKHFLQLLSSNTTERLLAQKTFGFSIGQLGPISLFDLRYVLLHAQLPLPRHLEQDPFYQLVGNPKTRWEKYFPPVEPRLLFVLVEGLQCSPKLQVMYSERFLESLEEAAQDYLDFAVDINLEKGVVSLPKLLEWYALDFCNDEEHDLDKASYEGLLISLSSLSGRVLSDSLHDLLAQDSIHNFSENIDVTGKKLLPFILQFRPPLLSFGILLDYAPLDPELTMSVTRIVPIVEVQPNVLQHLKDKCPIFNDLYEIFSCRWEMPYELGNLETPSKNLFLFEEDYSKVPVNYFLSFYKNMLIENDEELSWFSSSLSPRPNKTFFSKQLNGCFSKGEWCRSLLFVEMYRECFESDWTFLLLKELILVHLSSVRTCNPSSFALCIEDPVIRANTVLQNVSGWIDTSAIQSLKICLGDPKLNSHLDVHKALTAKLEEITLYKMLFDASEIYGDCDAKDCVYVFNNWQEVADSSIWDQSRVLQFIKSSERYDLAVMWTKLHVVNKEQKMMASSMSIIWYLSQNPLQEEAVFKIIDSFEDPDECVKLYDMVFPELPSFETMLVLVQYFVDNFSHEKKSLYINMSLGLKMLCALKSGIRESYSDLIAHPYLLLEQMLMNVELKDAEEALKAVSEDLIHPTDVLTSMSLSSVNQLVEDYASKALEVHFLDALLDVSSSSTLVLSTEETLVADEPFIIPLHVPSKDEWIPDAKVHRCQVCREERFNMFSRRHHCRRCGRVVCANCSQHALIVEGYGNIKVRVCDDCYNGMTGSLSLTTASFEKRYRILSSMRSQSPRNSPLQLDNPALRRRTSSTGGSQQAFRWILSTDTEQNASVRNEFSYEQTPSISLCYSILKLHSDERKCAQFMINLFGRLLGKIKVRNAGKRPMEIDYSLIISIMGSLLMNVKVKCHQVQDVEGEALAEVYFQHLDLIKLLVNANCRHLIPRETVTNPDRVRKLRDRLLEEERIHLALEVSTKFNLEKNGVWSCWGLFCLKAGDWTTARTKFQQCIKILNDKSDQSKENPLLTKILKVLEDSKYPGTEKAAAIFKSLASVKNIKNGLSQFETAILPLNTLIKKECLHYLSMYGTHFSTVGFYQRHGFISEALGYITEKKCDPEIFIEALFMPVLKNVQLSSLKHMIAAIDPELTLWSSYLFATCRNLERLKFMNVLYEIQLFMEDYARAAKSAINFYLSPALSYKTLFERQHHLDNAKKHYEKYLSSVSNSKIPKDQWRQRKNIKYISAQEVESYIKTISLQEEVTKFLKICASQSEHNFFYEVDVSKSKSVKCPPTLFGNAQIKSEVVLMVLINAANIDEGFELALKAIKGFHLDASAILCEAGRELVRIQQKQQIPHFLTSIKFLFNMLVKVDDIILECVSAIHKQEGDVEDIIKMLASESNKINAYLMVNKLKSAYLLALKLNSALDVRRIQLAAEQCGQDSIQRICQKWLEANGSKLKSKDSSLQ